MQPLGDHTTVTLEYKLPCTTETLEYYPPPEPLITITQKVIMRDEMSYLDFMTDITDDVEISDVSKR